MCWLAAYVVYLFDTRHNGAMDLTDTQHMPLALANFVRCKYSSKSVYVFFILRQRVQRRAPKKVVAQRAFLGKRRNSKASKL